MIEQDPVGAAIEAMGKPPLQIIAADVLDLALNKSPLPDSPEFICPSCMWQGDEDDAFSCSNCGDNMCPKCGEALMDRKEYDRNEANNAHDDDLEDGGLGL